MALKIDVPVHMYRLHHKHFGADYIKDRNLRIVASAWSITARSARPTQK